jgi:hypothetical protein
MPPVFINIKEDKFGILTTLSWLTKNSGNFFFGGGGRGNRVVSTDFFTCETGN